MKRYSFMTVVFAAFIFLLSCDSNRPESKGEFNYSLKVSSIQILADVEIKEGDEVIQSGVTDESGNVVFSDVKALTDLTVKICGGTVKLISSTEPVAWTGCMEASFKPVDVDEISVTVDILSTFISKYDSETRIEEFQEYLNITTLPAPALQTSLTDATKRYLWYQGIAKTAENVSKANAVTPETMYSTENLLNLLYADLIDDKIINGSTKAKFGSLTIEASILKNILADAIPSVDKAFSATDLKSWTDKIRNSEAKFLGGVGSGTDSEKPVIEIISPAGENAIVFGTVAVEAAATDNREITSLNCSITGEDMPELTDSVEDSASFKAEFDSTSIPDSKITIKCIASDGTNLSEKEISVTISNSNTASLKAFITNELTLWDSVTVYNMTGTKIQTVSFVEDEETKTALAPGIYRFVFKGGTYKPVFLTDETIKFDGTLETRGEVKAGEVTNIIATPLTTLREYLYRALTEKSDTEAEEKSLTLISEHIDSDFPLYIEPVSKNQLTENSKYYIVLAALERLAVLVGERHEPALEAGAITIEQVIKALTDDLKTDTKAVLDGGDTINQFPVDSYLFRYWYSIALKLFLESDENLTGLKFSDLQTVISNISMDESELFPEADKAKKVTDQPPVISEKQFKRFFETEYQNYSVENIIYANDSVFSLKFKALPDDSGDLTIDLVELFGDVEVQSLSDINEEGIYTAEIKFPVVADGEKSIGIRAVDNAENTGTATLQAIKDTIQPLIVNLGNTLPANVTTPLTVPYAVTETNPLESLFAVTPAGEAATVWTSLDPAILTGDITVTDAMLTDDGAYTLHFKSVDKAGNEKVQTKTLSFDRIIPTAVFTTIPEINENGFIAQNSIAITIIATDNLTGETELIHEFFNGTTWVENPEEPKNIWNNFLLQNQLYDKKYRVKDLAGNKSADINVSFTVDTVFPELTTNKTTLESRAYNVSDINLMLNSTCTDTNLLNYTYSINSSEEVIYTSPSTSLTNDLSFIEGYNTIVVKCTDKAGNLTEETINLVIDNTPPIPSFVSVPSNAAPMCGINKTLEVSGSDANDIKQASYWYQIDSGTISAFYSSTLNDTNEADLYYPAPSDTVFSNVALYKNKISGVSFYYALEDEAGNVSEPIVTDWFVDGKPPVGSVIYVNDHAVGFIPPNARTYTGQELDDKFEEFGDDYGKMRNWISDQFSDISKVYLYENNTLRNTYTNADFYDEEGTGTPCTVYFFSADTDVYFLTIYCAFNYVSDQFTYKVLFEDDCGNKGDLTDCKDDNYYCVSRSVNTSSPPLSLNVSQTKAEEYKLTISAQGANITYCNITGPNKNYSCQLKQGDQFIATDTPTPWESGNYTVTVRSKYSDGSTVSQVQQTFVIDRTAFSISFNNITTSSVSFITPPTLSYNIAIASAVKEAKFYFRGRTINYKYVPAGQAGSYTDTGEGLYANSSYQKLIYTATKNSGSFSLAIDAEGGIYDRIYYEITPNFGVIKTGEFTLAKKVKYIKQNSQDLRAWYEGGNIIAFKESIVSKKIKNSDVISQNTSLHDTLCTVEDRPFYNYEETKTTLKTTTLVADDYNTTEITPAKVKYKYVSNNSCNSMSNCAFSSAGCQNIKVGSSAKFCTGSTSYHYSEGSYIGGYSCSEWEAPSSSGQYAVPLYQVYCPFYRDMQYIPSGMSLRINDSERQKTFIVKNFLVTKMSSDCF